MDEIGPFEVAVGAGVVLAAGGALWELGIMNGSGLMATTGLLFFCGALVVLVLTLGAALIDRLR